MPPTTALRSSGLVWLAAVSLGACSPAAPPATEAAPEAPPRATVIDPQLEALERAKGVEATVLDSSRRALDEADAEPR